MNPWLIYLLLQFNNAESPNDGANETVVINGPVQGYVADARYADSVVASEVIVRSGDTRNRESTSLEFVAASCSHLQTIKQGFIGNLSVANSGVQERQLSQEERWHITQNSNGATRRNIPVSENGESRYISTSPTEQLRIEHAQTSQT